MRKLAAIIMLIVLAASLCSCRAAQKSILIIGTDRDEARAAGRDSFNADFIALLTLRGSEAALLIIPRDSLIMYRGERMKAAQTYAVGGAQATAEAICAETGVCADYRICADMSAAAEIIDRLGGVELDVDITASYGGVSLEPGRKTLSGQEALVYARVREDSEAARTERQKKLIAALAHSIKGADGARLASAAAALPGRLETNADAGVLLALAGVRSLRSMTLPGDYFRMEGLRVFGIDKAAEAELLEREYGAAPGADGAGDLYILRALAEKKEALSARGAQLLRWAQGREELRGLREALIAAINRRELTDAQGAVSELERLVLTLEQLKND